VVFVLLLDYSLFVIRKTNIYVNTDMHPNRLDYFYLNEAKCPYLLNHVTQYFFIDKELKPENHITKYQKRIFGIVVTLRARFNLKSPIQ
jgi:hypothetical protein